MRHVRTSKAATAWFVALGLALLGVAPGCGAKESPDTPGATESEPLPSVAGAEEAEYVAWLKANDLTRETLPAEGATRAPGKLDAALWPLHPREDVRLEALQTWHVQVDAEGFSPGGHLEFRKGRDLLWRDEAPFQPTVALAQGGIPSAVLAALKAGDTVTWGVVYGDKRDATTTFKVVKKDAVEKQVERVQRDRRNQKQTPLVKRLGKNQVLLNNSLFSEALSDYLAITDASPAVFEAWTRIVECLRRLDLKGCPLYQDASEQVRGTPRARPVPADDGLSGGGTGTGLGDPKPRPQPVSPGARQAALANAKTLAKSLAQQAAKAAAREADAARAAEAKEAEAKNAMGNAPQGAVEQAQAYERARLEAAAAKQRAEEAGKRQLDQDKLVAFLEKMGAPLPADVPDPQVAADVLAAWVSGLKQAADAKRAEADELAAQAEKAKAAGGSVPELEERARATKEEADALEQGAKEAARAVNELAPR